MMSDVLGQGSLLCHLIFRATHPFLRTVRLALRYTRVFAWLAIWWISSSTLCRAMFSEAYVGPTLAVSIFLFQFGLCWCGVPILLMFLVVFPFFLSYDLGESTLHVQWMCAPLWERENSTNLDRIALKIAHGKGKGWLTVHQSWVLVCESWSRGRVQDDCLKELEAQGSALPSQLKSTHGSLSASGYAAMLRETELRNLLGDAQRECCQHRDHLELELKYYEEMVHPRRDHLRSAA